MQFVMYNLMIAKITTTIDIIVYIVFGLSFILALTLLVLLIIYKNIINKANQTSLTIESILKHPLSSRLNRMSFIAEASNNKHLKQDVELWKVKYYQIYKVELPELITNVNKFFLTNKFKKSQSFPSIFNFKKANQVFETSQTLESKVVEIYDQTQKITELEFLLRDLKIVIQENIDQLFKFINSKKENDDLKINHLVIKEYKQAINKKITVCDYYIKIGKFEEAFKKLINLAESVVKFIRFIDNTYKMVLSLEQNGVLYAKLQEVNSQLLLKSDNTNQSDQILERENINKAFQIDKEKILELLYAGKINSAAAIYDQLINKIATIHSNLKFEVRIFSFFENNIENIQNIISEFELETKKIEELIILNLSFKNNINEAKNRFYNIKPFIDAVNNEFQMICSRFIKFKYSAAGEAVLYKCVSQTKNILLRLEKYYNDFIEIYALLRTRDSFLEEIESKIDNIRTTLLFTESIIYRNSDIESLKQYKEWINTRFTQLSYVEKNSNSVLLSLKNFDKIIKDLDHQLKETIYIKHNVIDEVMLDKIAQYLVTYTSRFLGYKNDSVKKINKIMDAYQDKQYQKAIDLGISLIREIKNLKNLGE
ncbi:hypothetical protein V2P24_02790 [Mycoplasma putrefaciens]